ncbi:hypothetical protein PC116_g31999 [Phytophthora cactorum]|uniref:Uncharacterized protein n=1 Tax=Phytophthora cactorum TaxID=29920 RepID=A0A8T1A9H6_9STRA|nr:hypothetical protein Pcac1_g26281 [Phytophthora cactorum]KAG2873179.1 hypothetical protein PC117_g27868 [Phytophthora cactorum]KAG3125502.1 hypothetical protein PC128_g27345 [Phytophthora cactorum]KAG4036139.1 hypothetical protein PC123_g28293 [Phytophthora cactorum]KAG4219522.1 hypothetical protein PC116_g31999 [Phytophthora cactorum]
MLRQPLRLSVRDWVVNAPKTRQSVAGRDTTRLIAMRGSCDRQCGPQRSFLLGRRGAGRAEQQDAKRTQLVNS